MKKALIILLVALAGITSNTQAQKLGHINSQELLMLMPERATIETEIQNHAKQLESQLLAMQRELETKYQDFQAKESMMTEAIRNDKIKELTGLEQRLNEFQASAQEDLQKKEQELTDPLIAKAKTAIDEVAKENSYTYIFDSATFLYVDETTAEDITPLVKKKLGLE